MRLLLELVLVPAVFMFVKAEYPFDIEDFEVPISRATFDTSSYRLPEDLDPIHFDVEITPHFDEPENGKEAFTFDGIVTITMRAVKDDISVLTIQENVREILAMTLTDEAGRPVLLNETRPFERVREFHLMKIYLRNGVTLINQDIYNLKVVYVGNINETPLSRGVFRGSYRDSENKLHWYAGSHLQPTNSRQAFPCFDEPGYKSTFNITVNRPAHFTETFSNMRIASETKYGNRVKEIFHQTPRMSAYLVSIHISEEFKVIADNGDDENSYRIIARPEAADQGSYALEVGPPLTKWLDEYFGINYYEMADGLKNDQIAVPDWASGATENWGFVSYRELRLLYKEGETNAADKLSIATITAHELAHKWFGNLVTARWWDNVWVNEGFASYFEYFAMDAVDPALELKDQFNIMYVQSALSADQTPGTRALQHTVNSPAEVTGHFSGISYSKGASLLQMLKHFVTENTFKKALHYFLTDRSYEHAFPSDIASAFARAVAEDLTVTGVDISEFVMDWVLQPGYPLITVDVDMTSSVISFTQERFFINSTTPPTDQLYKIPITFTTGNDPDWEALRPIKVMSSKTDTVERAGIEHEWVIFNVQQKGIYRVNYDTHNWEMLANALKRDHDSIHHLNRAQIVDDVFALMRAEKITYDLGFQILEFLKEDTSYYVWYPAITGFTYFRNRFLHLPEVLAEYDEILHEYLDAVITDLGYDVQQDEALTRTLNRFYILTFACNVGHKGCIDDAIAKYQSYRNGNAVNPNVWRHVFCQGILNGDYEDWLYLYQKRIESNNQAAGVQMLRGLGCTTNSLAIERQLNSILSDEVKAQDRLNAFSFLFAGHRGNGGRALPFLKDRINDIRTGVVLATSFNSVLSTLASNMDEAGLVEYEAWLRTNPIPEAATGLNAITSARNNMQWGTENADIILKAARGSATAFLK